MATARARSRAPVEGGWIRAQAARRQASRGPGLPEHVLRCNVESRLSDCVQTVQLGSRHRLRTCVSAAQKRAGCPAGVQNTSDYRRVANTGGRLRRVGVLGVVRMGLHERPDAADRKSTRLNSSHSQISYAVFCLKKKKKKNKKKT